MKKLLHAAAGLLPLALAAGADEPLADANAPREKPKSTPRPKTHGMPTKAALKAMSPEKRRYWEARIADAYMPNWWKTARGREFRAGRVKAELLGPMTRQVRRRLERKAESV